MKRRKYRKKEVEPEDDEEKGEEELNDKLSEIKEEQKFRGKSRGISAVALALGKPVNLEQEITGDPFKLKSGGGLTDIRKDRCGLQVGSSFSAETNHRDDDQLMQRYIQQELAKKKGTNSIQQNDDAYEARINKLFVVPEYLETKNKSLTEDMLSEQLLTGIPEVDLGLNVKIQNIEKTDAAVSELSKKRKPKLDDDDDESIPRNYTHDYARLDTSNSLKSTLDILKDDRYKQY